MKKNNLLLFFLLIAFQVSFAQQKQPAISFSTLTHDFGTINESDGKVTHKFEFKNTGSQPLIIEQVNASCGCTTPDWTKEPVMPGKNGFVAATYNPANRPGNFAKTIRVTTNSVESLIVLTIKGNVVPREKGPEELYPKAIGALRLKQNHIAFAKIFNNETKKQIIEVYNSSNEDMKLTFDRVPNHIDIDVIPDIIPSKSKAEIIINYDARKKDDWDYVMDQIYVKINNVAPQQNRIIVSAVIKEDFSKLSKKDLEDAPKAVFAEKTFNFATIKQGESVSFNFELKNEGKKNLIIRKIRAACGCTAIAPTEKIVAPGKSVEIKATFNSRGKRGHQNKTITVITNDPKNERVILWLKGNVETEN